MINFKSSGCEIVKKMIVEGNYNFINDEVISLKSDFLDFISSGKTFGTLAEIDSGWDLLTRGEKILKGKRVNTMLIRD